MKQCPQCRTTYTDDSLRFCLADGTVLAEIGEEETVVRPGGAAAVPTAHPPKKSGFPVSKVLIALLVIGFLGLLAAGAAGVLFYMNSGGNSSKTVVQHSPTPNPTSRPSATPSGTPEEDDDQKRLEEEMANVIKRLEKELQPDANRSGEPPSNGDGSDGRPTARVNSPGDGFLALRDEPDAQTGSLLAKIPHGAVVNLENCEKQQTTVAGRKGHWCMVTYEGETGYVFDAWLQY